MLRSPHEWERPIGKPKHTPTPDTSIIDDQTRQSHCWSSCRVNSTVSNTPWTSSLDVIFGKFSFAQPSTISVEFVVNCPTLGITTRRTLQAPQTCEYSVRGRDSTRLWTVLLVTSLPRSTKTRLYLRISRRLPKHIKVPFGKSQTTSQNISWYMQSQGTIRYLGKRWTNR